MPPPLQHVAGYGGLFTRTPGKHSAIIRNKPKTFRLTYNKTEVSYERRNLSEDRFVVYKKLKLFFGIYLLSQKSPGEGREVQRNMHWMHFVIFSQIRYVRMILISVDFVFVWGGSGGWMVCSILLRCRIHVCACVHACVCVRLIPISTSQSLKCLKSLLYVYPLLLPPSITENAFIFIRLSFRI